MKKQLSLYILLISALISKAQTLNWTPGLVTGNINVNTSWSGSTPSSATHLLINASSFTGTMTTINVTVPTNACAANNFTIDLPAGKTVNLNFNLAGNKLTLNGAMTVSGTGTLNVIGSNTGEIAFYNGSASAKTHSFTTNSFFKGPDLRFRIGTHIVNGFIDMSNLNSSDIFVNEEGAQTFITNVTFNAFVKQYQNCASPQTTPVFQVTSSGGALAAAGQPATVTINNGMQINAFSAKNSVVNTFSCSINAFNFTESSAAANPFSLINLVNGTINSRSITMNTAITTGSVNMDNKSEIKTAQFFSNQLLKILGKGKLTLSSIDNYNSCGCALISGSEYGGANFSLLNINKISLRNLTFLGPVNANTVLNNTSNSNFDTDTLDVYTALTFRNNFNNAKVNKLLRLNAGASMEFGNNTFSAPTNSINLVAGCELQINGTCSKSCYIQGQIFNFSTPASYTATVNYATIVNCSTNASPAITCANSSLLNPSNITGMPATMGTLTGFTGSLPVARTLFWLGTAPIASADNYLRWNNPANWSLSNGGLGGECPPTMHDSVIFPVGSLVRLDDSPVSPSTCGGTGPSSYISTTHVFNCKSMVWLGAGNIYDSVPNVASFNTGSYPFVTASGVNELRIHGSLITTPTFSNNFHGDVVFSAWQSYPIIQSNHIPFNRHVLFRGLSNNAKWKLMDTLVVNKFNCYLYIYNLNSYTNNDLQLHGGYLDANGFGFSANSYAKINNPVASVLDIRNSRCLITRSTAGGNVFINHANLKGYDSVKAIPSHIIFTHPAPDNTNATRFVGGGFKYDTLTFRGLTNYIYNYPSWSTAAFSANRITDSINRLITYKGISIANNPTVTVNSATYPSNIKSFVIKRADVGTVSPNGNLLNYNALQNNQAYFDSLYVYTDAQFNKSLRVNNLLWYNRGHIFNHTDTTVFGKNAQWIINSGCGGIGGGGYTRVINGKFYKPVGGTGDMGGPITTTLVGTPITATIAASLNGVLLENCTAVPVVTATAGVSYSLTNSSDLGGNTSTSSLPGWIFTPKTPRNLVWVASTAATTADMWQDCNNWGLANASGSLISAPPNAPPYETDDVWFTDASFIAVGDTVRIDDGSTALCHTMRWTTTTKNPVFKGALNTNLLVFGSMYFSNNMQTFNGINNYMQSSVTFRGTEPANIIDTKGLKFAGYAYFNGDANTTQWTLASNYNNVFIVPNIPNSGCVSGVSVYKMYSTGLLRGKLILNGYDYYTQTFISNSNKTRTLDITNSTMHIQGSMSFYPCFSQFNYGPPLPTISSFLVRDSSNVMTLLSGVNSSSNPLARPAVIAPSTISMEYNGSVATGVLLGAFSGGGKRYNLVHFTGSAGGLYNSSGDTIMRLKVADNIHIGSLYATAGTAKLANQQNTYIGAIYFLNNSTSVSPVINVNSLTSNPYGRTLVVDSLVANGNVDILDSIHIRQQYRFGSGNTYLYRFASAKTCYLSNNCDFKPIGSSGSATMNFYSTTAGSVARIRKDSGLVCVGYLNIRDIHAVGNGASLPSFATAPQSTPIGAFTTPLAFYADTVWASSYYSGTASGPVLASPLPTSGRAVFSVDNTADLTQSTLNRGWEVKNFGIAPSLSLTAITPTIICADDSIKLTLSGVGGLPFVFTYSLSGVGSLTVAANSPADLTTYNSVTGAFTYEPYIKPTITGSVSAVSINVERCFNDIGIGTGILSYSIRPVPSITVATTSTAICAGQSVTLTPSGATTYTLLNSGSAIMTNTVVNPLATTIYTVIGALPSGCKNTKTITVNSNALPTLSLSAKSNVTCFGTATGAVTLTPSGGAGSGYTITPSSTGLVAGAYTYTLIDANGCKTNTTVTITQPTAALTAITTKTNNTDCSTPNGIAIASPSGGTSAYTYSWSNGATTQTITALNSGVYTATVTDNNLCTYTTQATVTSPAGPVIAATSSTNSICNGNSVTIAPSGGTSYTVMPSIGSTSVITSSTIFTPTTTTSYSVYGINASNCLSSNTINLNVTVNPIPSIGLTSSSNTICSGQSVTITPSGANTYTLINTGASIATNTIVSPTATTIYSVSGTSAVGCVGAHTIIAIMVNAIPSLTNTLSNSSICVGQTATLTSSGAESYTLSSPSAVYSTSTSVNPTSTTVYTISGMSAEGCTSALSTITLNVNSLPIVTAVASSTSICSGETATLTAGGATGGYMWTSGPNTTTYTVNTAGIYTVTGTDGTTGCSNIQTVNLTVNANPSLATSSYTNVSCLGTASGSLSLSASGTSGYSYAWSPAVSATSTAIGLNAGVYTTTVTDVNGCKATITNTIAAPSTSLSVSIATSTTGCGLSNGTATVSPSGGWSSSYTYTWSSIASTTNTATGLGAGLYNMTVIDANGCSLPQVVSITNPTSPTITIATSSSVVCAGISSTITPSGASTYTLVDGASSYTTSTSQIVTPTITTVFSVIGADASNCVSGIETVTINVNALPSISITASSSAICIGASATITPSGANTYTLVNTGTPIITNTIVNPTSATVYSVTGTSIAGCLGAQQTLTINVNASPTLSLSASNSTICSGSSAVLTAIGADTYSWTSGVSTSTYTVNPIATTVYSVIGTNTVTNCNSSIESVTVNVNPTPTVTANATQSTVCSNGSISLIASGASTYTWSGTGINATNQNIVSPIFAAPSANTYVYSLLGTSSASCTSAISTVTVNVVGAPTSNLALATQTICEGANSSFAVASPQSGVVYTWNGGTVGTNYAVPSSVTSVAGTYTLDVVALLGTGTNTCSTSSTGTLLVNPLPIVNVTPNEITICNNESITYKVTNPINTSSYLWSYNNTSGDSLTLTMVDLNQAGTYTVTVTDKNHCVNTNTVVLIVNDCNIVIPQLLTPNSDGKNDFFVIKNIQRNPNNKVQVYNRWGNLIYSKNGYQNDWAGTYDEGNGGKLPAGTYFIMVDFGDGITKVYNGFIQLEY